MLIQQNADQSTAKSTYASERFGWWQIFTRAADGSDEERQISKTDAAVVALAMSPDGREMLVRSDRKEATFA